MGRWTRICILEPQYLHQSTASVCRIWLGPGIHRASSLSGKKTVEAPTAISFHLGSLTFHPAVLSPTHASYSWNFYDMVFFGICQPPDFFTAHRTSCGSSHHSPAFFLYKRCVLCCLVPGLPHPRQPNPPLISDVLVPQPRSPPDSHPHRLPDSAVESKKNRIPGLHPLCGREPFQIFR